MLALSSMQTKKRCCLLFILLASTSLVSASSFVSLWNTENTGVTNSTGITLPLQSSGTYNFTIDWGDSSIQTVTEWNSSNATHQYALAGNYTVNITGKIQGWFFNNGGDRRKILDIQEWGPLQLGNSGSYFRGASNLIITANDTPNLTGTTSMQSGFRSTDLSTANNINNWDVSGVTNMGNMFSYSSFNSPIADWDVSNCSGFTFMFSNSNFNQPIGTWDMTGVTSDARYMFYFSPFNQDISGWDVSGWSSLHAMFFYAQSFNQDISAWNVSGISDFSAAFKWATSFNQNLSAWDVSHGGLSEMFAGAQSFNGDITNWNTSSSTYMTSMFSNANSFNQDISGWDTSRVTDMREMFYNANDFNQDLSAWDVSNVTTMQQMFSNAGLSRTNYDSMLLTWSTLPLKTAVPFAASSTYTCIGEAGRKVLTEDFNWTVSDNGFSSADYQQVSTINLNKDASCGGNGVTFGASNIVLDCGNNTINFANTTAGIGVAASDLVNITVRNCVIEQKNESLQSIIGLSMSNISQLTVQNVNVSSSGTEYSFDDNVQGSIEMNNAEIEVTQGNNNVRFASLSGTIVNPSNSIVLTSTSIFVNTSANPSLNASASITFGNITYPLADIFVDFNDDGSFVLCPSNVCVNKTYVNGTYSFDVTHFTEFSVQDTTPVPEFSTYALLAAMILVVGGFFVMRKAL
ncbi:BspA family leucine-rich repeat surface protein [Candidatus Woesearchaeota archaeon]|nr:BspA family leucine-rich repeat surface protein [Candidatus Woesearchaeota archaeon]